MAITRCLTLGGAALILAAGCGQLWRPFLENVEPGGCDSAEAACTSPDLGVVEDLTPLGDWEVLDPGTQADLRAIWGYDGEQTIWFGGDDENLLSWRPGTGVRKELLPSIKVSRIHAISGWPGNDERGLVVAVGEPNVLVYWNGLLWKDGPPANPVGTVLTGVTLTQSGYLYVSGDSGALYYGPVGGAYQVTRLGPSGLGLVVSVARADASSVWAILANGDVVRSYGGMNSVYTGLAGQTLYGVWAPPPMPFTQGDLTLNGPSRPYVVGAGGLVTRADTNGRFSPERLPEENDIVLRDRYAVTGNQLGEVWVAGQDGRLLFYDGKHWKVVPSPMGEGRSLRGIWVPPGGRKPWVVGDRGLLMRRRTLP